MTEKELLIDELVSKAGPTAGQIKLNQDPAKVARLMELGWEPAEKKLDCVSAKDDHEAILQIQKTLADHEKRIKTCEIRR
jgi:hypothetical protein